MLTSAGAGEREAAGVAGELAAGFRRTLGEDEVFVKPALGRAVLGVGERLDQAAAGGGVGRGRDGGRAGGEELLLLEFDPLPRRVADHDIEAAAGEDVGELERPVEGADGVGNAVALGEQSGRNLVAGGGAPDVVGERHGGRREAH